MPQFTYFSHPRHAAFSVIHTAATLVSSPITFSPFSHYTSPPSPRCVILVAPSCFHLSSSLLTLHPLSALSLCCHAFNPPLLSPQSHLIPLSARPFIHFPICHFSYFIACHSQFCLNSAQPVTFKSQHAAPFFLVERCKFFFVFFHI